MEINNSNIMQIGTINVNYSDSAISEIHKLKQYTGAGEKRIFIKTINEPIELDNFFFKNTNGICFISKDDLLIYLRDAYVEYHFPFQQYKYVIKDSYDELLHIVNELPPIINISFNRTYDKGKRYYLVAETKYRKQLHILSDICLPQITKLSFVKIYDKSTKETYIQLRPLFYRNDLTGINHPNYYMSIDDIKLSKEIKTNEINKDKLIDENLIGNERIWQSEWRAKVLEQTLHCAITKCGDDRILIGCHIKPVYICLKEKCGNEINPNNGIMLTPTFHKLFDDGFLSFDDENHLLLSSHISINNYERLNVKNRQRVSILELEPRIEFLNFHRKQIYKG